MLQIQLKLCKFYIEIICNQDTTMVVLHNNSVFFTHNRLQKVNVCDYKFTTKCTVFSIPEQSLSNFDFS